MIVTVEELSKTELYSEIVSRITRNDQTNAELQILAAQELCKSYLFKFDLNAIFGTDTEQPTFKSEMLKKVVKIIATYYLLCMSSPNINLELARANFEDAKGILKDLRDGKNNIGMPYAQDNPNTPNLDESNSDVSWSSNPKRTNFF